MSDGWPRRCEVSLHSTKDQMLEIGEALGIRGEALGHFKYALYEVAIDLEVQEDGTAILLAVDGRPLVGGTIPTAPPPADGPRAGDRGELADLTAAVLALGEKVAEVRDAVRSLRPGRGNWGPR